MGGQFHYKESKKTKAGSQIKYELEITVEEKEAGPRSQMDNMEMMKRIGAVEAQLRRKTGKAKGKMGLKRA